MTMMSYNGNPTPSFHGTHKILEEQGVLWAGERKVGTYDTLAPNHYLGLGLDGTTMVVCETVRECAQALWLLEQVAK